jgi:hypothetical protein
MVECMHRIRDAMASRYSGVVRARQIIIRGGLHSLKCTELLWLCSYA